MSYPKKHIVNTLFLVILLIVSKQSNCQVIQDTGDVFAEISAIIASMPGHSGNNYSSPNANQLNIWENTLNSLLLGNYSEASNTANTIGYNLVEFLDTTTIPNTTYYILKTNSANYWGTYVYNPNYCRPLVIQSPHPKKDFNTGKEGIHIFKEVEALFFCLSGTSRCNNSSYSSCDGSTSVCSGSSENYRISDLSHNTSTIFQRTTDVLLSKYNNSHFIQLHGFSKLTTDPYVILSNGTQVTPSPDYLSIFKTKLFDEDHLLTFKIAHVDLSWTRLRGFTNTQGRLINSSLDFCNSNATTTNGRFFHVEQEKTKLRDDSIGWNKVANALKNTFICSPLFIEQASFNGKIKIYPNPTTNLITIEGNKIEKDKIKIYNIIGQEVSPFVRINYRNQTKVIVDLTDLPSGIYILKTKTTANIVYKQL